VLAACDHATPSATAGAPNGSAGSSKGKPMTGHDKAFDAFRDFAQKKLGTKDVEAGPDTETVKMEHTIGQAWAFVASAAAAPQKELRGWAVADGRVITTEQNFGVLLEQAGLWATPASHLETVPPAVAWSLGNGYHDRDEPEIKLAADGSGAVTFDLRYQQAGGGGSLGPQVIYNVVVTVAKDHSATVKLTKK
jgi:hypothetical protein